ncbi:MAG: sugar transporter [Cellvibrio sp. 79]|nr:MAG: sugar transporter [Cellvibrio sp. 79]
MNTQAITGKSLLQYGFIALPVAFAGFPLYVLAPDFFATQHGLSLTLLGTLLLFIRVFDAIQDPLIGWLTDKLQDHFLPVLAVAGTVLCLSIFGLFNGHFFSPAIWFSLCMIFAVSAYSVLIIVLGAQATLWTSDTNAQTKIAGAREAFGIIGLVTAVSVPTLLSQWINTNEVYLWYAGILFLLMLTGIACFSRLTLPSTPIAKNKRQLSPLAAIRALPTESWRLFIVYGVSMLASSTPAILVVFYVRDLIGAEQLTGLFLLLYFLCGAAAMPLWKKISVRHGKYKTWCFANILAVAGFICAFFLNAGDVWPYAAVCVVSGFALGADLTLPPSILADHIHTHDNCTCSGSHYAFLAFIGKASLALASAIALPALDAANFKPQAVNSETALATLSIAYALIPCVLKLGAAGLLYGFFIRSGPGGNNESFQNHGNNRSSHHA